MFLRWNSVVFHANLYWCYKVWFVLHMTTLFNYIGNREFWLDHTVYLVEVFWDLGTPCINEITRHMAYALSQVHVVIKLTLLRYCIFAALRRKPWVSTVSIRSVWCNPFDILRASCINKCRHQMACTLSQLYVLMRLTIECSCIFCGAASQIVSFDFIQYSQCGSSFLRF